VPLRSAIALDARLAEAHYLLGVCLHERSEIEEARQALTTALEISPTFAAVREELVNLYEAAGRQREAIEQLEALAALEPTHPERLVNVGLAYANWGRTDAAVLTLARAADRFPDEPVVRTALGRVWLFEAERDGDPIALEKALEALQPTASSPTASGETLALLGRAFLLSGQPRLAERTLVEAARRPPADPLTFRHLADAAQRLGHTPLAKEALLRYVALVGQDNADRRALEQLNRLR
jgi:tetratricopeptide (TPR) repeat protein